MIFVIYIAITRQLNAAILENDIFRATSVEEYLIVKQNFIGQRTAH